MTNTIEVEGRVRWGVRRFDGGRALFYVRIGAAQWKPVPRGDVPSDIEEKLINTTTNQETAA